MNSLTSTINSEAAEQGNSYTEKYQTQMAFMTIRHHAMFLRFFVSEYNDIKLQRLLNSCTTANGAMKVKDLHDQLNYIAKTFWGVGDDIDCCCDICVTVQQCLSGSI